MAKIVTIDGEKFVSENEIIGAMMEGIMMEVYGRNNLVVDEDEARLFKAYEDLLEKMGEKTIRNRFREKYIMERFWAKRHVE